MNAIISLCHFCEIHGPQVLFCTQPLHPQERSNSAESDDTVTGDGAVAKRVKSPSGSSSVSSDPLTPTAATSPKNDSCEGCSSVRTGFISRDEDAQVNYISSKQPYDREVYSMSRQACLRSLSGEVCPGRDGPIFFGNDHQGHVLSYTFYIKDCQARGLQTRYSILVVMMDKIYLLNSWPFLVPHLKTVIDHLQNKANKVYEREDSKCPQRALRLTSSIHPGNFIQQRGGNNKPARSLRELTDDKNIFKLLHVAFVWILKACGNRITETLLEGPPTEDSIIDMEKQEETEEGFCLLFSKKVEMGEVETVPSGHELESTDSGEDDTGPRINSIRHLMQILGNNKFHILAHHVVIGNQIIVRGSEKSIVKSFLNALKSLLPRGCCLVIPYSETYEESWRCNFLGLPPEVDIPRHIMSDEMFVLVDVSREAETNDDEVFNPASDTNYFEKLKFNMASPLTLPDKAPTVLHKMEIALKNESLTEEVVEQCLICLKEEWMNKVKVLFKFTKAGGSRSEEDTKKLLQVVGAKDEDTPLLKFWMHGLSVQYRNHILTASKMLKNT